MTWMKKLLSLLLCLTLLAALPLGALAQSSLDESAAESLDGYVAPELTEEEMAQYAEWAGDAEAESGSDSTAENAAAMTAEEEAAMAELGAAQGDSVIVSTEYGTAVFTCRNADLPDSIVFIPYGPSANRLTGHAAGRSGMPAFKGIGCTVRRDDGG